MKKAKRLSAPRLRRPLLCSRCIVSTLPSGYVTERSKITSVEDWNILFLDNQEHVGRDEQRKEEEEEPVSRKYSDDSFINTLEDVPSRCTLSLFFFFFLLFPTSIYYTLFKRILFIISLITLVVRRKFISTMLQTFYITIAKLSIISINFYYEMCI